MLDRVSQQVLARVVATDTIVIRIIGILHGKVDGDGFDTLAAERRALCDVEWPRLPSKPPGRDGGGLGRAAAPSAMAEVLMAHTMQCKLIAWRICAEMALGGVQGEVEDWRVRPQTLQYFILPPQPDAGSGNRHKDHAAWG